MTLGQFALAVGATRRWVLNACGRLKLRHRYDETFARRLALARSLSLELGMPLPRAFALAAEALAVDPFSTFERTSDDGAVTIRIDLPRFFTAYQIRLARARTQLGSKVRGRKPSKRRRGSAIKRAMEYGWDVTLHDANLALSQEERLRQLSSTSSSLAEARRRVAEP